MIYALLFNLTGGIFDGTTVVNAPIPAADDGTGLMQIPITGNLGRIDPQMLWPLVGPGGFLLAGIGITPAGGAGGTMQVGLVGRTAGSVWQMLPPFPSGLPIPYSERPAYVPPQYLIQIFTDAEVPGAWTLRLDIAPLRTRRQAARGLKIVRPQLFGTPEVP